jgi:hypothetical protein
MAKMRLNTTRKLNKYRLRKQREAYLAKGYVRIEGGAWVPASSVKRNGSRKTKYKNSRAG